MQIDFNNMKNYYYLFKIKLILRINETNKLLGKFPVVNLANSRRLIVSLPWMLLERQMNSEGNCTIPARPQSSAAAPVTQSAPRSAGKTNPA